MNEIIPAINSAEFNDVRAKLESVGQHTRWVHIDVADGTFTKNALWHESKELARWLTAHPDHPLIEVHLMVEHPEEAAPQWIAAGAKRIIVHIETLSDFARIKKACDDARVFLMLSVTPQTPASALDLYFDKNIVGFQVLAVTPGLPGQSFIESSYEKLRYIRNKCPHCDLEIDGGVKTGIAKKCKEAGANLFVAASAIFGGSDIAESIASLKKDVL